MEYSVRICLFQSLNVLDLCPQLTTMKVVLNLLLCLSVMVALVAGQQPFGGFYKCIKNNEGGDGACDLLRVPVLQRASGHYCCYPNSRFEVLSESPNFKCRCHPILPPYLRYLSPFGQE